MISPAYGWHTPPCPRVAVSPARASPVVRPPVVGSVNSSSSGSIQSDVTMVHPPVLAQAPRNWTPPRPAADAAFVQVSRWKPADSGAETARESGLQWLLRNAAPGTIPAPSYSLTERYSHRPWPVQDAMALKCLETPNLDYVSQRVQGPEVPVPQDQSSSMDHAYRHSPSGHAYGGEDAFTAVAAAVNAAAGHFQSEASYSKLGMEMPGTCGELLELLGAIASASRRQSEAAARLQERVASLETTSARLREELTASKADLREAESQLQESRAEALAAKAEASLTAEAELSQEKQKCQEHRQETRRLRIQLERLEEREEELQASAERAQRRERQQDELVADLKQQLHTLREARHQEEMAEVILAAAQEVNLLPKTSAQTSPPPRPPPTVRPLLSPSQRLLVSSGSTDLQSPPPEAQRRAVALMSPPGPQEQPRLQASESPEKEAPPRGLVAAKILFFDQRCQTPTPSGEAGLVGLPTPLGRHVVPTTSKPASGPDRLGPTPSSSSSAFFAPTELSPDDLAELEDLVASPPTQKECRRRLSYPEARQSEAGL
eukprot:s3_g5.t1